MANPERFGYIRKRGLPGRVARRSPDVPGVVSTSSGERTERSQVVGLWIGLSALFDPSFEGAQLVVGLWTCWLDRFHLCTYARRSPLVLINGLSEQSESWFRNHPFWRRYFDVYMPNLLVYDGPALHARIDEGQPITVDYLVEQLHVYLQSFVQTPPYHLVAASLGGKIAVEYAVRYPENVSRLVLLCPSGMGDDERLPIVEGVRRHDLRALVDSVFFDPRCLDRKVLCYYEKQFASRRWRQGFLKTINGTKDHSVRERLRLVQQPTLLVSGQEDRIVDPRQAASGARLLPNGQFLSIPQCGHAPQMEKPWLVNRLVMRYLTDARVPVTVGSASEEWKSQAGKPDLQPSASEGAVR